MSKSTRKYFRWLLAIFFIVAGANHFVNPRPYLAMMPSYLPPHAALVWISGVAEMVGGMGVLFSRTRVVAGWGLIALLLAVFPANLNVAIHGWPDSKLPSWILWLRLPLQFLLLWWVYRICITQRNEHGKRIVPKGPVENSPAFQRRENRRD